jgi:hypothetical protein
MFQREDITNWRGQHDARLLIVWRLLRRRVPRSDLKRRHAHVAIRSSSRFALSLLRCSVEKPQGSIISLCVADDSHSQQVTS